MHNSTHQAYTAILGFTLSALECLYQNVINTLYGPQVSRVVKRKEAKRNDPNAPLVPKVNFEYIHIVFIDIVLVIMTV